MLKLIIGEYSFLLIETKRTFLVSVDILNKFLFRQSVAESQAMNQPHKLPSYLRFIGA